MKVLKRKMPLGAVAFLLVLALAAMGLVYGNWSQTLTIGGTVTTGSVSAEFPEAQGPCGDLPFDLETKNVGEVSQEANGKELTFTVTGAYPNYAADCEVEWLYTGNIPGVLHQVRFVPKDLTNCTPDPTDSASYTGAGQFDITCNELRVQWTDGACGPNKPPGTTIPNGGSLKIFVQKGIPNEKAKYSFNIQLEVIQWDKRDCPPVF